MRVVISSALLLVVAHPASGQAPAGGEAPPFSEGSVPAVIATVTIHPPAFELTCTQHSVHAGDPVFLGDAAGLDCTVVRPTGGPDGRFPRFHDQDGGANEHWYGWDQPVFAPFDGVVEQVHLNPATNRPGTRGEGPASFIAFRRADGVHVVYGHITAPQVSAGDRVVAGQPVARVGNNGFAWYPHLHLGAWKGHDVVQMLFDPRAIALLQERQAGAGRQP
jgi:hypothetical protein